MKDVEPAELIDRGGDETDAIVLVPGVAGQEQRFPAGRTDPIGRLLRIRLFLRQVRDRDVGALPGDGDGDA